jgi:hypothetical protein
VILQGMMESPLQKSIAVAVIAMSVAHGGPIAKNGRQAVCAAWGYFFGGGGSCAM